MESTLERATSATSPLYVGGSKSLENLIREARVGLGREEEEEEGVTPYMARPSFLTTTQQLGPITPLTTATGHPTAGASKAPITTIVAILSRISAQSQKPSAPSRLDVEIEHTGDPKVLNPLYLTIQPFHQMNNHYKCL